MQSTEGKKAQFNSGTIQDEEPNNYKSNSLSDSSILWDASVEVMPISSVQSDFASVTTSLLEDVPPCYNPDREQPNQRLSVQKKNTWRKKYLWVFKAHYECKNT
jgi:hypothetical protein